MNLFQMIEIIDGRLGLKQTPQSCPMPKAEYKVYTTNIRMDTDEVFHKVKEHGKCYLPLSVFRLTPKLKAKDMDFSLYNADFYYETISTCNLHIHANIFITKCTVWQRRPQFASNEIRLLKTND